MKNIKKTLLLFMLLTAITLAAFGGIFTAFANEAQYTSSFTGYSLPSGTTLYDATNTYFVDENNELTPNSNNTVLASMPQITVFTHGMGGGAFHWSNAGTGAFQYDLDALPFKLANSGNAVVYWAVMENVNSFKLIDIGIQGTKNAYSHTEVKTLKQIEDISKHIIIIWDGNAEGNEGSDNHYARFNYMLSKIVYDVKVLNGGILPKVNLIGHSFGGIINMRYALAHPDLVHSLVSVGTPYTGSNSASVFGELIVNNTTLLQDILAADKYEPYMEAWNKNYELYDDIDAHMIGGYSSLRFLREVLDDENIKKAARFRKSFSK